MVFLSPPPSPAMARGQVSPKQKEVSSPELLRPKSLQTPTLLTRRSSSIGSTKKAAVVPAAAGDLGRQRADEVWLVIGGTGMAGFGVLRRLSDRGQAGGLVLAATRGSAEKAWLGGVLPGITPLQTDINDSESLRAALAEHPPVTHIFYSALVRTSFNGISKTIEKRANIVAVRALQNSVMPALMRGSTSCCCGGEGAYDAFNVLAGNGDVEENRQLFKNVLEALDLERLRYCCVVTGAKHYGMHLGPKCWPQYREPFQEDSAEAPGESAYAALEEALQELSAQQPQLSSLVLRPSFILGPVPRPSASCMNLSLCLGVYALLCKELDLPLRFLGGDAIWTARHNFSHSDRIAQLALNGGAALPGAAVGRHLALNAGDHESFSYNQLWPQLATWAGCSGSEGPLGSNGASIGYALGQHSETLEELWGSIIKRHCLRQSLLQDVLNISFLEQSMSVGHSARLGIERSMQLEWAAPTRDGGWVTLRRALDNLCAQGLLPEAAVQ